MTKLRGRPRKQPQPTKEQSPIEQRAAAIVGTMPVTEQAAVRADTLDPQHYIPRARKVISEVYETNVAALTPETELVKTLCSNQFDLANLVKALDTEFHIETDIDELLQCETVGDIYELVGRDLKLIS